MGTTCGANVRIDNIQNVRQDVPRDTVALVK